MIFTKLAKISKALANSTHGVAPCHSRLRMSVDQNLDDLQRGHETVMQIRAALDQIAANGLQRTFDQSRILELFISSCAKYIYRTAFDAHQSEIEEFFDTKFLPGVMVQAPRRYGKSKLLSAFIAALLYVCSDVTIVVIAANSGAALSLKRSVRSLLVSAFAISQCKIDNTEHILITKGAHSASAHFFAPSQKGDKCTLFAF